MQGALRATCRSVLGGTRGWLTTARGREEGNRGGVDAFFVASTDEMCCIPANAKRRGDFGEHRFGCGRGGLQLEQQRDRLRHEDRFREKRRGLCQQLTGITSDEASAFNTYCTFFAGTANGGATTVVSSCSPTGSVGSCVNTVVFSGQTVTETTYYYAPGYTASSASSVCASANGVWTAN